MSTFEEEAARLKELAKSSVNVTLDLAARQMAATMLLHAALAHLQASNAFWEAAEMARGNRPKGPRLELVPFVTEEP